MAESLWMQIFVRALKLTLASSKCVSVLESDAKKCHDRGAPITSTALSFYQPRPHTLRPEERQSIAPSCAIRWHCGRALGLRG